MVMAKNPRILVVSWNPMLEQTRRLILGTYFESDSAGRMPEVERLLRRKRFELVVLCDTLSDSECVEIADLARVHNRGVELILLESPNSERPEYIKGRRIECFRGPLCLLKACAEALEFEVALRHVSDSSVFESPLARD
jgi:hypothetical protein